MTINKQTAYILPTVDINTKINNGPDVKYHAGCMFYWWHVDVDQ